MAKILNANNQTVTINSNYVVSEPKICASGQPIYQNHSVGHSINLMISHSTTVVYTLQVNYLDKVGKVNPITVDRIGVANAEHTAGLTKVVNLIVSVVIISFCLNVFFFFVAP